MILSAQSIREIIPISPFTEEKIIFNTWDGFTLSYGLSAAGYDVRVAERLLIKPNKPVKLASTMERFTMPNDILARVCDKSTWARRGIFVQNTVIEPGWCGYLTLEITSSAPEPIIIDGGAPIAQILFEQLDYPTELPYSGKYQNQKAGPQAAL